MHTAEAVGVADGKALGVRGLQFHVFVSQRGHGGAFGFGFLLGGSLLFAGFFGGGQTGFGGFFTCFGFGFALLGFAFFQIFQEIVEALLVFSMVDFLLRFFGHLRVLTAAFGLFCGIGYALLAQRSLDIGLQFFQVSQFIVDFLLLRRQLFLLFFQVSHNLVVGVVDITRVTQEAGFLTGIGVFQEEGNRVGLAVFIVAGHKARNLGTRVGNFGFQLVGIGIEFLEFFPCIALFAVDAGEVVACLLQLFERGIDMDNETLVTFCKGFLGFHIVGGGSYGCFEIVFG